MTSGPFLPWHSDFGRTVLTDVPLQSSSDDHRFLLRSAIAYQTDKGTVMVLRVEAIHPPPPHEHPQPEATGPPQVIVHTPDLSGEEIMAHRAARERMTVTVNGLSTHRNSFSDDGFRWVGEYWVTPVQEGSFTVEVSYEGVGAEALIDAGRWS
jgi:hypothetical protein